MTVIVYSEKLLLLIFTLKNYYWSKIISEYYDDMWPHYIMDRGWKQLLLQSTAEVGMVFTSIESDDTIAEGRTNY